MEAVAAKQQQRRQQQADKPPRELGLPGTGASLPVPQQQQQQRPEWQQEEEKRVGASKQQQEEDVEALDSVETASVAAAAPLRASTSSSTASVSAGRKPAASGPASGAVPKLALFGRSAAAGRVDAKAKAAAGAANKRSSTSSTSGPDAAAAKPRKPRPYVSMFSALPSILGKKPLAPPAPAAEPRAPPSRAAVSLPLGQRKVGAWDGHPPPLEHLAGRLRDSFCPRLPCTDPELPARRDLRQPDAADPAD